MTLGRNSLFYPLWCHTVVVPYHSVVENFCTLPYRLQYVYMHQSKVYPRQRCHTIKHATLSVDQKSTLLFLTLTILSQFRFILIVTPTINEQRTKTACMHTRAEAHLDPTSLTGKYCVDQNNKIGYHKQHAIIPDCMQHTNDVQVCFAGTLLVSRVTHCARRKVDFALGTRD